MIKGTTSVVIRIKGSISGIQKGLDHDQRHRQRGHQVPSQEYRRVQITIKGTASVVIRIKGSITGIQKGLYHNQRHCQCGLRIREPSQEYRRVQIMIKGTTSVVSGSEVPSQEYRRVQTLDHEQRHRQRGIRMKGSITEYRRVQIIFSEFIMIREIRGSITWAEQVLDTIIRFQKVLFLSRMTVFRMRGLITAVHSIALYLLPSFQFSMEFFAFIYFFLTYKYSPRLLN